MFTGGDELVSGPYFLTVMSLSNHASHMYHICIAEMMSVGISSRRRGEGHFRGCFVTYQSTLISRLAFFPRMTLYLAKRYTGKI